MTTNTQPQTQQSGGDELKHTLMHTKVIVYTQGKEFFVNLGTVISYGDNWKVIMQHIEQATQAREREAEKRGRVLENDRHMTFNLNINASTDYKAGFKDAVDQVDKDGEFRAQQLQLKPQAGEGGE